MPARSAYIDGEFCAVRPDGTASFADLQAATDHKCAAKLVYFPFDVLHLDGANLMTLPLSERLKRPDPLLPEQNRVMQALIDARNPTSRVRIVERDHRELNHEPNAYDRYVSVGVYQHAGKNHQRPWIESIATALKSGGIALSGGVQPNNAFLPGATS